MPRIKDLTGQRFGKLTVISMHPVQTKTHRAQWNCLCDCGNTKIITAAHLIHKQTRSCGCYRKEVITARNTTHNMTQTSTYRSFLAMHRRCYDKYNEHYLYYGARGITVCDRWKNSFENFHADMGNRPEGKTLERINNEEGYSPQNCVWATPTQQASNRRNNVKIEINGEIKTVAEWCRVTQIKQSTVSERIKRGWNPIHAVLTPTLLTR